MCRRMIWLRTRWQGDEQKCITGPCEVSVQSDPRKNDAEEWEIEIHELLADCDVSAETPQKFMDTVLVDNSTIRYPPHPLSFPTPCRSPGGGLGVRHLVNPKTFVVAHCVVVWVTVLWGTATCIPCTHGGTFCLPSLKWNLTAQPCFPLGQM